MAPPLSVLITTLLLVSSGLRCIETEHARLQLTTSTSPFQSLIVGLTARIQCAIYRCQQPQQYQPAVIWYKDDLVVFNGTEFDPTSGMEPANIVLQKSVSTSQSESNNDGSGKCVTEEFTLLLKNLSKKEAGEYRCQIQQQTDVNQPPQQLDFRLDVLESGLKAGFHENFTYDYTECCLEHGLTPLCRAMCKPRTMHQDFFDPTSCRNDDYRGFLSCATDNGRRDYTPCCRQSAIPTFCFEFCSNKFEMLKRSHRLCLYYLPEIFSCFNRPELQLTSPPQVPSDLRLVVREERPGKSGGNKFCFKGGSPSATTPTSYTIHVKEMPMEGPSAAVLSNQLQTMDVAVVLPKTNRRMKRGGPTGKALNRREAPPPPLGDIFVATHESIITSPDAMFYKIEAKSVERDLTTGDLCFTWYALKLHSNSRYVVYVQASNDYGTSEPSQPTLFSTAH